MTKKEFFKKGDVNYMKKTLSLFLAVLMIVATMPMAFAAEELTANNNIVEWPTVKYKNSENVIYYGQTFEEGAELVGGVVKNAAGEIVPGKFDWKDPTKLASLTIASSTTGTSSNIRFTPDDTTQYSGFTKSLTSKVKYWCVAVDPVFKTELSVEGVYASGTRLSDISLLGGIMANPYDTANHTETGITSATWSWEDGTLELGESGYYVAVMSTTKGYTSPFTAQVWVEVAGNKTETEIVYPDGDKILKFTWDGITKMEDLEQDASVLGVYAVEKGTDTIVPGKITVVQRQFDRTDYYVGILKAADLSAYKLLQLVFTPDDSETYRNVITTEPVTLVVTKGIPAWTSGETLVLTYDYGATPFGQYGDRIEGIDARNLNCYDEQYNPYNYTFMLYDEKGEALTFDRDFIPDAGTYNYNVKVSIAGYASALANWDTDTLLPVTIVVAPANAQVQDFTYSYVSGEIKGNYGNLYLNGSVDITIGGNTIEDVAVTQGRFTANWKPADTKNDADFDVTVKYTAADGDNAVVESDYTGTISYKTDRNITLKSDKIGVRVGNSSFVNENDYLITGTEVTVRAKLDDFAYWVITDADGNEIELDITSGKITDKTFTFTMPDCDLTINAVFQYQLDEQAKIDECECLCHSDNPIAKFFWNIILKLMDIFSQLFGYENVCDCGFAHGTTKAF